jgi:hypothetical protein
MPTRIEYISIIKGRCEVCAIEDIKELCPELHVEGVGDTLDVVVLKYGKIKVQKARPQECVPPEVPT